MEEKKVKFLEEAAGEQSMMRLITMVMTFVGIALCVSASIAGLFGIVGTGVAVQMGTTLISVGVGGKVIQKFGEK